MPDAILGERAPSAEVYRRIGQVAAEWGWVEQLLADMLAHFCHAEPGAIYVLTQNVSNSTVGSWLRTLIDIKIKDAHFAKIIADLLTEVDDARTERNVIVHGLWRGHEEGDGFAWVQTLRWDRAEVARDELWSLADLDESIDNIQKIQLMLSNLGVRMGFLKLQPSA
jgi:hypothetical protein